MSERQLIIHAGFHKSGTTSLQESLFANRKQLLKLGIEYPNIGAKAHHRIAWSITQKPWGWKNRGGEVVPARYWERKAKAIDRARSRDVVISSEFFSELDIERIQRVREKIKRRNLSVIFTLRPLVKLLPSIYQQFLKYGADIDYESWLHSVLDEPGESKVQPTFWKRHSHDEVIGRWANLIGAENVKLLIVNEERPDFLFEEFNKLLNLPLGTLTRQETGSNRSLTVPEISLLLEINRRFPKERTWSEYEVFIRSGYIRELTDYVQPATMERLATPIWAIEKGNEIGRKIRDGIAALGVSVIGDINSLAHASVPAGNPKLPTEIDIATVAAAMLTFDRKTVARFPVSWIQVNLLKRLKRFLKFAHKRVR